ncbi:MAG: methyltransferase domain-containing protein, partial [Actinobacteria bacterium]|nr:methyltransferase domain-containing protein [Actinomycetota bacterium]
MSGSVSFDRAAGYYDGTRSLSPGAEGAITELLAGQLAGLGSILEIGVGTGRISLPLHAAGIDMTGVDLSLPMMEVLRRKNGGRAPFPLGLADATRLPFADDSFGGAVVCHVFHLIPPWTEAADEL